VYRSASPAGRFATSSCFWRAARRTGIRARVRLPLHDSVTGPHSRRPPCRCRCAVERAGGERLLEAGLLLAGARDCRSSRGVHQPAAPCRIEGAGPTGPARARQALRDGGRVHLLHPRRPGGQQRLRPRRRRRGRQARCNAPRIASEPQLSTCRALPCRAASAHGDHAPGTALRSPQTPWPRSPAATCCRLGAQWPDSGRRYAMGRSTSPCNHSASDVRRASTVGDAAAERELVDPQAAVPVLIATVGEAS
jgi:hypothetical protein